MKIIYFFICIVFIIMLIFNQYYYQYIYYNYLCTQNYNNIKNIKCSDNYVINLYNKKLHIQNYNINYDTFVLNLHGYGSHANRIPHKYLAQNLNNNNIAYFTFDFTGHGYSDGIKGYIENVSILIEDVMIILVYIFTKYKFRSFFIQGHSMGGGVAIIIADILTYCIKSNYKSKIFNNNIDLFITKIIPSFRGLILLAPLIKFNYPKILLLCNKYLAKLLPYEHIPIFIFNENKYNYKIWKNKKYREYIEFDGHYLNKNRLTYGDNIRFGTLVTLSNLSNFVQHIISNISYPFIVLYDYNKDIIIQKESIDLLIYKSISKNKKYVNIENGLHDPLANETKIVITHIIMWINQQLNK